MKKIIVIDDTRHLLEEINDLLQMEGYNVITAHEAAEGIRKIEQNDPDLIITDILMPNIDGFALISEVRSREKFNKTPIIVLSAGVTKQNEEKAKALHADLYLKKPCSAEELLLSIEKLLNWES